MYGIVSDIFITRPYSFFFSICPEYKIQGRDWSFPLNPVRTAFFSPRSCPALIAARAGSWRASSTYTSSRIGAGSLPAGHLGAESHMLKNAYIAYSIPSYIGLTSS